MPSWRHYRGRASSLTLHYGADHPDVLEAKQRMREERWLERIQNLIAAAPPTITAAQRAHVAAILQAGDDHAA